MISFIAKPEVNISMFAKLHLSMIICMYQTPRS